MTTDKQRERQQHRDRGRYAKVNPCYVCGKSAGVDYPDADETVNSDDCGDDCGDGW